MNWSEEFGASIADLLYKILLAEEFKFSHTKIRSIFKIFNQKYPSFIPTLKARRSEFDISKVDLSSDDANSEDELGKKNVLPKNARPS